jgi:hypothetical protein
MPSETKGLRFLVRALGSRNFRLFFFGQAVSLIGTWMQLIAMRWLVYRLTKSELMLGVVGFVSDIPLFLLVPFAGVLADRLRRHGIMIVTQTLAALQAAVLAPPARSISKQPLWKASMRRPTNLMSSRLGRKVGRLCVFQKSACFATTSWMPLLFCRGTITVFVRCARDRRSWRGRLSR